MCIFCKIVSKEIPCYKIYEDDQVLAFLDIKPVSPGHTLAIPKTHYQNLEEISEADLATLIVVVKKIGALLKDKLGIAGYNVIENNDASAGQIIPHIHFHIIPRFEDDGIEHWPGREYKEGEANEVLRKIKN